MTINEYQHLAMRTANEEGLSLSNMALGLAGESGEVADLVKKTMHQLHPLDRDKLFEELGDVAWYLALGATVLGTTLEAILEANILKLQARYPDGFDSKRSINREV